ncbi:hypothetical protein BH10PSE1_BH10PSE1_04600 [soil metagenome]
MPKRTLTWGLIAVAAASLLTSPVAIASQSDRVSPSTCQSTDTACRLDGLERRLDYLIDLMERQRPERPGRSGAGRTVDIPVNQSCGWGVDGCSVLAARLCSQGGFGRGVPLETQADPFNGPTLKRATCMD